MGFLGGCFGGAGGSPPPPPHYSPDTRGLAQASGAAGFSPPGSSGDQGPQIALIVLEAYWEGDSQSKAYSFGAMLHAFFLQPHFRHVDVRIARLRSREDLQAAAVEFSGLHIPAVVVFASHGEWGSLLLRASDAMTVSSILRKGSGSSKAAAEALATVDPRYVVSRGDIGDFVRGVPAVRVVHLGVCRGIRATGVRGEAAGAPSPGGGGRYRIADTAKSLRMDIGLPKGRHVSLSGYTTYADWSCSAIAEFYYYRLLLDRHLDTCVLKVNATMAAEQLLRDVRFAGYSAPKP
mmetsp:Transcript_53606/g.170489  ORF Transcript_53606/g.170489 Transcript_53606/m.170489 type:complete len:292 (+) Transcript_53606:163-1038(+)